MRLYLDIDGVFIRDGKPTLHCFVFLRWAVDCHQPFWLTTRDAHGRHDGILRAFRHALSTPTLPTEVETLLRAVRPTQWHGSKVIGIDLASDFVWIDDDPLRVEIDALRDLGLLERLLIVKERRWFATRRGRDWGNQKLVLTNPTGHSGARELPAGPKPRRPPPMYFATKPPKRCTVSATHF